MRLGTRICLVCSVLLIPSVSMAQHVVAIYAPSLDFKDGSERNAYVTKVAKVLSSETGLNWEGRAFGRASDFESARSSVDVAILDADYFSSKGTSYKPVAMLSAHGQTTRHLKVIAKKGSSDKLYDYRGKRLAVVANAPLATSFVTASALGHEVSAQDYFGAIDEVRDVRSALNAVEMGKADLSLVYDGYDSDFTTVYTTNGVGLPIIVLNGSGIPADKLESVRTALQNMHVSTSSFITGTAAYAATDASAYRRIAHTKKSAPLQYQPMKPEHVRVKLTVLELKPRSEGVALNPFQVQYVPTLDEFDKKLESRL